MSNVTIFSGNQLPAFAKRGATSGLTASLAGGSGGASKRISIKGGVFRLIADGKEIASIEDRYLDVVIVAAAPTYSRTFYLEQYEEGKAVSPACWSSDGKAPDSACATPQATNCEGCPQNIKGSGQGESRACRYSQRMAVKLANDIEGGDVMQLVLPATSIFGKADGDKMGLQAYARFLAAQNCEANMIVTRMKFDTASATPKLLFKAMRWLTDDEYNTVVEAGESPEAKQAIILTVAQTDKVPAATLPARGTVAVDEDEEPPVAAPKKTRAKPAVVESDEDTPPPAKRATSTAAASVPAKQKLADIAAEWDED